MEQCRELAQLYVGPDLDADLECKNDANLGSHLRVVNLIWRVCFPQAEHPDRRINFSISGCRHQGPIEWVFVRKSCGARSVSAQDTASGHETLSIRQRYACQYTLICIYERQSFIGCKSYAYPSVK